LLQKPGFFLASGCNAKGLLFLILRVKPWTYQHYLLSCFCPTFWSCGSPTY